MLEDGEIGEYTGWYGLIQHDIGDILGRNVQLYGYPLEMDNQPEKHHYLWGMEGPIEEVNSIHGMLHYSIDTTGGQSGSAVYYETNGEFNIVGVHVLGVIDGIPFNQATYMSPARIDKIKSWIRDYSITCHINLSNFKGFNPYLRSILGIINIISYLNLSRNGIGDEGAIILSNSRLYSLKNLDLHSNNIGDSGAAALSDAGFINLTHLNLRMNRIGPSGAIGLSRADFTNLISLNLRSNRIGDQGAAAFADASFENLTSLNLSFNSIGHDGASRLFRGFFINLTHLDMRSNHIGDEGAYALSRAGFGKLLSLNLSKNGITNIGAGYISSAKFPNLTSLDLSWNQIDNQGAEALAQSNFPELAILNLRPSDVDPVILNSFKLQFRISSLD